MMDEFDPVTGELLPPDGFDPATGEVLPPEDPAPVAGMDFHLNARDAAEYVTERLGQHISASTFRQLVMVGQAPPPLSGNDFKAIWSQAALSAWVEDQLEAADETAEDGQAPKAKAQHRDVYDFFEKTYSPYYELHVAKPNVMNAHGKENISWCKQWWLHTSVVARLVAAWYTWEDAYAAGGGAMSSWILEHGDRHFERIMADGGPFEKCKTEHTEGMGEYPTEPAPAALRLQDDEETPDTQENHQ